MVFKLKKNAEIIDLIEQMHEFFPVHLAQAYNVNHLFLSDSCYNTAELVYLYLTSLDYVPDSSRQVIQTPFRLSRTMQGDCKSYSIFAAALMASFGVPVRFVYTCNNFNGTWHVYAQVKCPDQIVTIDGTIDKFNYETPAKHKFLGQWMQ